MMCRPSIGTALKTSRLEQSLAGTAIRSSKMSHIRRLSASDPLNGAVLRYLGSMAGGPAVGGSRSLWKAVRGSKALEGRKARDGRKARGGLVALSALVLAIVASQDVMAQARGNATAGRGGPALPSSGHQTEAIDLNEGKSAAELFQAGCAVCHQSAGGLAKGRSAGELTGFLRQHYTSSIQHAQMLSAFLSGAGPGRGGPATATPTRQAPVERPPAAVGRRPAAEEAPRAQEAARPESGRPGAAAPERESPARRKPVERPERPAATARTAPPPAPAPEPVAAPEEPAAAPAPVQEAPAPESAPPPEAKPAAPEIPL